MNHLAHPERLWLLAAPSILLLWWLRGKGRRRLNWNRLGETGRPASDGTGGMLLALICVILAVAQPRWGKPDEPPLPPGRDVVLLIDTSRSMAAEDAVPNRLGVAAESAAGLLGAMGTEPGDRVAVVAFAGVPVLKCGLTSNLGAALGVVKSLRAGEIQPGGTDLAAAIDLAVDSFDDRDHAGGRVVVVLTDGEDLSGGWEAGIGRWRDAGIVVHAVTIGDAERGHTVPVGSGPLTYGGRPVESRRDDGPLGAITAATGGVLLSVGLEQADMADLYRKSIAPREAATRLERQPPRLAERFQVPLLAGLGCLLFSSVSLRSFVSRRSASLLAVVLLVGSIGATAGDSPRERVAEGVRLYASGRFEEAYRAFDRAVRERPESAVAGYGAGASLYQLGRIEEASAYYRAARKTADPRLAVKIDYALGNCRIALGDAAGAVEQYDRCLSTGPLDPSLAKVRDDARVNREYALERIPPDEAPTKGPDESPPPPESKSEPESKEEAAKEPAKGDSPESPETPETKGSRGEGGAGGDGRSQADGRSPEERLRSAVESIREARRRQLPDPPASTGADGQRKDW